LRPKSAQSGAKSGLDPDGDVRLTANIWADLHLRLKIEAARRRTNILDLIEELVEAHLNPLLTRTDVKGSQDS